MLFYRTEIKSLISKKMFSCHSLKKHTFSGGGGGNLTLKHPKTRTLDQTKLMLRTMFTWVIV